MVLVDQYCCTSSGVSHSMLPNHYGYSLLSLVDRQPFYVTKSLLSLVDHHLVSAILLLNCCLVIICFKFKKFTPYNSLILLKVLHTTPMLLQCCLAFRAYSCPLLFWLPKEILKFLEDQEVLHNYKLLVDPLHPVHTIHLPHLQTVKVLKYFISIVRQYQVFEVKI